MKKQLRALKNNTAGFTFVELLVVIVIMAVLVASTANYLFSQGGSKARDIERKNDMKQVAALLEQFNSSYGEPPSSEVKNRKIKDRAPDCEGVGDYKLLMKCFKSLKYAQADGLASMAEDPKEGIENDGGNEYRYLYGADNNGWKVCALLENQTDPDLNDSYEGSGTYGDEGGRTYCVVSSNRKLSDIDSVEAGSDESYLEE
ncbi:MAG: type II secretion system protein [Patescibacteria group bacterium]